MKILLIGDFSSFSKNLSEGFRRIGHQAFVFSWGDGFKRIEQDPRNSYQISLRNIIIRGKYVKSLSFFNRLICSIKLKLKVKQMANEEKWDIALVINPDFLKEPYKFWMPFFTKSMISSLLNNQENIFLICCGKDIVPNHYWATHKEGKMHPILHKYKKIPRKEWHLYKYYSTFINKVIPVTYSYAVPYRNSKLAAPFIVFPTIPMPITVSKFISHNEIGDRVIIFHGINRPKQKGTPFIIEAMDKLSKDYPSKVLCIAKGKMPLKEYLEIMKNANIVIDQCYAGSAGMNALYAMSMGKVVLGGNEPENMVEFGCNVPVINIKADANQIYSELVRLVQNPELILKLSQASRKYVESIHDSKTIAEKYINSISQFIS